MKQLLILLLFTVIFKNAFTQTKDVEAIKKLNQDWLHCYLTKDSTTLAGIFANDFILIAPNGKQMTKRDIIGGLHRQETVSIDTDSIQVRMLTAEVGLVTAYITFVLKQEGKEMTGQNCYQDVYIKRKNQWFAIAAHVTLLSMK